MSEMKAGARFASVVCAGEVIIIMAPEGDHSLTCGGSAMVAEGDDASSLGSPADDAAEGIQLGKRYTNAAGDVEILCVKPGDGSLAFDGEALVMKGAKPLPSSD